MFRPPTLFRFARTLLPPVGGCLPTGRHLSRRGRLRKRPPAALAGPVLAAVAACFSSPSLPQTPPPTELTATIVEREGATTGSMVAMEFPPVSDIPDVGQEGFFRTVPTTTEVEFFGVAVPVTTSLGAGQWIVTGIAERTVTVRITDEGSKSNNTPTGEAAYVLPQAGEQVVVRWTPVPDTPALEPGADDVVGQSQ